MSSIKQWLLSFWTVLISPTPKTFTSITQEVNDKFGEAIAWIVIIIVLFLVPISIIYDDIETFNLLVVSIVMVPIWFLLFVFLMHKMNQVFFDNNKYCYDKLLFSSVVAFVVTSIVILLLTFLSNLFFPESNNLIFLIAPVVYWFVISTISVKVIMDLNYLQSFANVLISFILSSIGFFFVGTLFMLVIQDIPRFFW
jgi:hypothetical protein